MNENTQLVYSHLAKLLRLHGYSPSVRELASETGLGLATVKYNLDLLLDEGLISKGPKGMSRTLQIRKKVIRGVSK